MGYGTIMYGLNPVTIFFTIAIWGILFFWDRV
uniref:Uncharacterized protein n=1 Tax=Myoviridae sp. ctXXl13 TaxID=2827691 RepID=A0A8S5TIV1_9CAUD|nr:MAG TPA: hypothetical protein [Myoviridae sp. ctXXl13]